MWRVVLLGLAAQVSLVHSARPRLARQYRHHDALVVARCEARCWTHPARPQCIQRCLTTDDQKPGECPTSETNLSAFDAACLFACTKDQQCPGIDKCCRHRCGITCQPPHGLERVPGLPRIPSVLSASERKKGRALRIKWSPADPADGTVLYILEERHHAGSVFTPERMGSWTPLHRSNRTSVKLKGFVKPGRWYQFRVAAVNRIGSRGWSAPSKQFITSLGPRPPAAPPNVKIGGMVRANETVKAKLSWDAPASDLPVHRYRVFWSRRLHGASPLDSVLVQQRTLPKNSTSFRFEDLRPNSLYFLQVQALAQFGKNRLKGEKAAVFLNTTVPLAE